MIYTFESTASLENYSKLIFMYSTIIQLDQLASEIATPTTPTKRRASSKKMGNEQNTSAHVSKKSISEISNVDILSKEIHKPERMPELRKIHSYVLHDTIDPLLSPDAPTPRKKSTVQEEVEKQ